MYRQTTNKVLRILVSTAFFLSSASLGYSTRIYVSQSSQGANNGSTWADAFGQLYDALLIAQPNDEIWVAKGIYLPTANIYNRNSRFIIPSGVKLYGGFNGNETSLSARAGFFRQTVLSGDLFGDDFGAFPNLGDNSHRIVEIASPNYPVRIDGFLIRGGNDDFLSGNGGAGLYCSESELTLANCFIEDHMSIADGAGMLVEQNSQLILEEVQFVNNTILDGTGNGAGIAIFNSTASFLDIKCISNHANALIFANSGGGIYLDHCSLVEIKSAEFDNNIATDKGGGLFANATHLKIDASQFIQNYGTTEGGGIYITGSSELQLNNSRFYGNTSSYYGAGISCHRSLLTAVALSLDSNISGDYAAGIYASHSRIKLNHCEFKKDSADRFIGGALYLEEDTTTINECVFMQNYAASGGAVGLNKGRLEIYKSDFFANHAITGGAWFWDSATVLVKECAIKNNYALNIGGAAFIRMMNRMETTNSTFSHNQVSQQGPGAVFVQEGKLNVFNSCSFVGNQGRSGGALSAFLSTLNVYNSEFSQNQALQNGGAINAEQSEIELHNCLIDNNKASEGGGMYLRGGEAEIQRSYWRKNLAVANAGALRSTLGARILLDSCIVYENSAPVAASAAIYIENSQSCRIQNSRIAQHTNGKATIDIHNTPLYFYNNILSHNVMALSCNQSDTIEIGNNTFTGNIGSPNFSPIAHSALHISQAQGNYPPRVINNIFWQNDSSGLPFSAQPGLQILHNILSNANAGTNGNFQANPSFVDTLYHIGGNSPAIDAGYATTLSALTQLPTTDFEADIRQFGNRIDIGADEYVGILANVKPDRLSSGIVLTPNPSTGKVALLNINEKIEVKLIDSKGKNLFSTHKVPGEKMEFDLGLLPDGIYLFIIKTLNNVFVEKLVIENE